MKVFGCQSSAGQYRSPYLRRVVFQSFVFLLLIVIVLVNRALPVSILALVQ